MSRNMLPSGASILLGATKAENSTEFSAFALYVVLYSFDIERNRNANLQKYRNVFWYLCRNPKVQNYRNTLLYSGGEVENSTSGIFYFWNSRIVEEENCLLGEKWNWRHGLLANRRFGHPLSIAGRVSQARKLSH